MSEFEREREGEGEGEKLQRPEAMTQNIEQTNVLKIRYLLPGEKL